MRPLCSLLHTLLMDCRMSENCKSLVLQDKYSIEIFLSPVMYIYMYINEPFVYWKPLKGHFCKQ